ncbi:hypothetical protein QBC39DRAFT_335302 [Podospora conica]|nr:hypothetical protein QBC39DRAFT_335302 [Schizothecium conicum]
MTTDGEGGVHRIGFTLLKGNGAPKHGPFRADIVFVHGLKGSPRSTWEASANETTSFADSSSSNLRSRFKDLFRPKASATAPPQPESSNKSPTPTSSAIFWPNDFLAKDLSEARIWTYGYNADAIGGVFQARNKNSISQHGRDLSVQIEREVLAANGDPVLFVAHSLGGIIVKDALHRSQDCQERCKLVVFLGTPHRGSDAADWGKIAANLAILALQDSNRKVLDALQVDSEVLDNINLNFTNILDQSNGRIRVHSFQEGRGMTGIKGLSGKVVSDFSSKLDLSRRIETVESIDADHRQMARCPSQSCHQYRAIRGVLKDALKLSSGKDALIPHVPGPPLSSQAPVEVEAAPPVASHPSLRCLYIPMPRNGHFVGRQDVLETLKQKLFEDHESHVALVGLGGVGKTQVALQFAHWAKESKPGLSIFWVSALSDSTFRQACADIVKKLAISTSGDDDPRALLQEHLSSTNAGEWLLIVDNADDDALLFGDDSPTAQGLMNFLPESETGRTLITTRSIRVADNTARGSLVHLGKMGFDDAMSHLESCLDKSPIHKDAVRETPEAKNLLDELEYLPLAITQAAAYLYQNQTPFSGYLRLLRRKTQGAISLMSYEFRDTAGDKHSKNAIAKTWLVSFEQIRKSDPDAARLLAFISFIQPKAIPRSLLPPCKSEERMTCAIGTLCAYSFLSNRGDKIMFDMHSLVHLATRIWLNKLGLAAQEAERAIRHVRAVFPNWEHENRFLWREFMPHALKLLEGTKDQDTREKHDLFQLVGMCLHEDGRIKEAVKCLEEDYQWRVKYFPETDDGRLVAQYNLASLYRADGQTLRSLKLSEGVVEIQKQTLPYDHPNRLASQHALAGAYLENGDAQKAVDLLEAVVGIEEKVLAEDHPNRLSSQYELAEAYLANGEVQKAVDLLEGVVRIREKVLAEDHPNRLASQHQLARAYLDDGEVKKAVDLLEGVARIQERVLAEDHPNRLVSQHALGVAYLKDGQVTRGIKLLEHVVKTEARMYDEGDRRLLVSREALEEAYVKLKERQDI